jgi:hypothetical protein
MSGASMVWAGRGVLIASARTTQNRTVTLAGRYDPERAGWTPITPPPRRGRVILAWAGAAVVDPFRQVVYDPAADRWLRLPAEPERAGGPPLTSWGVERALLRTYVRATGAVQVQVLVPARPKVRP